MAVGKLGECPGDVLGMGLDVVHGAQALERAQHPQVGEVIIAAGEVEQPEPVADRERVEVERWLRRPGRVMPGFIRPVHLAQTIPGLRSRLRHGDLLTLARYHMTERNLCLTASMRFFILPFILRF